MKLLLVDSDRDWIEMLTGWLKTRGYEVRRAYTGEQAKLEWMEQHPDLVIIDHSMKDIDALAMCRQSRMKHDALVMIITGEGSARDEVQCLEAGADDYLRKPFLPGQLLARIRALSRRGRITLQQRPSSIIKCGPLHIDSLHNTVNVSGKMAYLTPIESKLLYLLAININQVCTAEQIITYIWGYEGDSSLIKPHIRHLRMKVELDPGHPRFIQTVPGMGYKLTYIPAQMLAS